MHSLSLLSAVYVVEKKKKRARRVKSLGSQATSCRASMAAGAHIMASFPRKLQKQAQSRSSSAAPSAETAAEGARVRFAIYKT